MDHCEVEDWEEDESKESTRRRRKVKNLTNKKDR